MLTKESRIESVLKSSNIGVTIPCITSFELHQLNISDVSNCPDLPTIRLGKQIERVFSFLINRSLNYSILKENIQIIDGKITIGELDFIIKNNENSEVSHLEIVYKFYVYDPNNSETELDKWIGPNRKDSFIEKFDKLKSKQFPLLYKSKTADVLNDLDISKVSQKLCFMASLFVPFSMLDKSVSIINNSAIVGYWLTLNDFKIHAKSNAQYYLPKKQEWGIAPHHNSEWHSFSEVSELINESLSREFSPLVWIKTSALVYKQCFIVWW
jgi:hypothetical protein